DDRQSPRAPDRLRRQRLFRHAPHRARGAPHVSGERDGAGGLFRRPGSQAFSRFLRADGKLSRIAKRVGGAAAKAAYCPRYSFGYHSRRTCPEERASRNSSPGGIQVNKFVRLAAAAVAAACFAVGSAHAVDYPTRPVKWVVPYPPGGTTDTLARIVAQWLSEKMHQQFVIENKPGGGNNIGTEYVIRSDPDGYTMLLVNPANGINTTLYKNLKFNFPKDIQAVAGLVRTPNVMVVNKDFPAKTVQEFIDYCKKNPGKINMASSGAGTSVHLSGELFKKLTGCDMLHVPYKGAGPALTDIMGNQVQVIFDNMPSSAGFIKAGAIRALG